MDIRAFSIQGAFQITPRQFADDRGLLLESFRGDRLAEALGHRLDVVQTNVSVSSRGTVRGIHFAQLPPSQAKRYCPLKRKWPESALVPLTITRPPSSAHSRT